MAKQYEGTWEEVSVHASELAGRHVRVTLLDGQRKTVLPSHAADPTTAPETNTAGTAPGIVPGRMHGKPFKEWPRNKAISEIPSEDFDAFDQAIAENRAMRRELAQDTND